MRLGPEATTHRRRRPNLAELSDDFIRMGAVAVSPPAYR